MDSKKMIFWFEELGPEHNDMVGKKCANMGKMTRMGLAVPPGFALSIDMYREFIRTTGIGDQLTSHVKDMGNLKGAGIAVFEELSQRLRSTVEQQEMPGELKKMISSYYTELCSKTGIDNLAVSVRSAGTQSRPGMFETYLNVRGIDDVLDKIKKVWASANTPRGLAFRANKGFPILGDELGVAIPKMVNSRTAGIAFTVNPLDGDGTRILLEANWGLGEGVVSGAESVDGFVVSKDSLEIETAHIGHKTRYVVYRKNGADWAEVPGELQRMACLSEEEVKEISRIARSTEEKLSCPQDMEWAIDQDLDFPDNLFWLQTRQAKVVAKKAKSSAERLAEMMAKKLKGL